MSVPIMKLCLKNESTGEISELCTMVEFVDGLTEEIGSVARVMTRAGFRAKAVSALDRLIQRKKECR